MIIPPKLNSILLKDEILNSIVTDVITTFYPIYKDNKLYFFDEYTDHGIQHIEKVLNAAEYIISNDSFDNLSSKEVAILILSVILHDIGMHIEFSTFVSLLSGEYDKYIISVLDTKTWKELWEEYLTEVKRFSSIQKKNVFGNESLAFHEPDLSNKDNLTGYDKKLIGEFIRRHHARLAHEVAFAGLHGSNNEIVYFGNSKLSTIHRELIGILARSHGINIRDTFPYLEEIGSHGWRNPDDVNIFFLMVVLRIADYIQVDNSRVSSVLLKLKLFNSPLSLKEHETHLAINSISFNQPDNEKIFALCSPNDSKMLVKLKRLFIDIQNELDVSWAILGEVYSFLPNKPKIKFRRITSNLDDHTFLKKLKFVPQKVNFEVNNELSKLLVGPLYGNNPIYGVRELIQNSIDACIERNYLELKKTNNKYIPKIVVSIDKIDDNFSLFKIVDNGKGMSLNEILHYFLSVGTSFRKSLSWKKDYVDDQGHSLVSRNGKFGIGVLAAFLLGDELTVETIHYNEKINYSFRTKIDSDFIEIEREKRENSIIGTSISLIISNAKRDELVEIKEKEYNDDSINWIDWYIFDFPEIEYYIDKKKIETIPLIQRDEFHVFRTPEFEKIEWKYKIDKYGRFSFNQVLLACNGIIITKNLKYQKGNFTYTYVKDKEFVITSKPSILIEDKEGLFPLKLDRNDIDCIDLPFEKELLIEVSKEFIAEILTLKVDVKKEINEYELRCHNANLVFTKEGYSFNFDYFVNKIKSKYTLVRVLTTGSNLSNNFLDLENCIIYPKFNEKINLTYQEFNIAPCKSHILLKTKKYNELFKSDIKRISLTTKRNHKVEIENDMFVVYNYLNFKNETNIFKDTTFFTQKVLDSIESIQELDFEFFKLQGGEILNSLLEKYIGENYIIPYDLERRKKMYKKAFSELHGFMK